MLEGIPDIALLFAVLERLEERFAVAAVLVKQRQRALRHCLEEEVIEFLSLIFELVKHRTDLDAVVGFIGSHEHIEVTYLSEKELLWIKIFKAGDIGIDHAAHRVACRAHTNSLQTVSGMLLQHSTRSPADEVTEVGMLEDGVMKVGPCKIVKQLGVVDSVKLAQCLFGRQLILQRLHNLVLTVAKGVIAGARSHFAHPDPRLGKQYYTWFLIPYPVNYFIFVLLTHACNLA